MAFAMNSQSKLASDINVTPMIDVLLVLLIIFMVIVPAIPRGESARLPQPATDVVPARQDAVVLEMFRQPDGRVAFKINQQAVARVDLSDRLNTIFANRPVRQMFLKADDQLSFDQVADVIDISHAIGVDSIGLMTPRIQAAN